MPRRKTPKATFETPDWAEVAKQLLDMGLTIVITLNNGLEYRYPADSIESVESQSGIMLTLHFRNRTDRSIPMLIVQSVIGVQEDGRGLD